ncbi:hypothetical protein ATANTOWER_029566 [Ataeniobius toweri]|uniref:Uncharacterized protein n=1 Tax=Ataeniobius toweri TaxID=208326 RepID=A0ABU7AHE4_9TELE|nr:hypothetical protein [Ataeniobius toweri]
MSYNLHVICEGCLGPDHANLAVHLPFLQASSSGGEATAARHFLPARRGIHRSDQCSLDEALGIFGAGRESDDSAPETATDISTPFLWTEDAEAVAKSVQAQGLPMSATTPW